MVIPAASCRISSSRLRKRQLRVLPLGLRAPRVETGAVADARRDEAVVERVDQLVVHQHVGAARLVLERLDLAHQASVVREERRAGFPVALDERLADEDLPRLDRVDRPVLDTPVDVDWKAVERRALLRHHGGLLLLPVRLALRALQQMCAEPFQPFGLDPGDRAGEKARRFGQLGSDDPARRLLGERRSGVNPELDAPRTQVVALLRLETDVPEQPSEQCAMHPGVLASVGHDVPDLPAELRDELLQLRVDVAPFPHPVEREEVVAAGLVELPVRFVVQPLLEEPPELEEAEEVRLLVGELLLRLVGGLRALERPLARVLHRQRSGDHQHFGEASLLFCREYHPADPRIDRKPRELAPDLRQVVPLVHCPELREERVAVGDRPRRGGIDERELLDRDEPERLHPQDHRRERRAEHLRLGERRTPAEVLLVVEADADPGGDPPAAARPLLRRGLADPLDLELLDLAAVAVPLDPREAGVDDEADAGHRERGLRHVRRQHDAAPGVSLEDALLLLCRQPAVERKDLGLWRVVLAERLRRLADLAFAGEENEHVAGARAGALVHGIDERLVKVDLAARVGLGRPVAHFHRIEPPRHLDHRRVAEVLREPLGVERCRGDDELQIGPARQQLLHVAEEEVDVQAALMRLVDDQRVVLRERRVALGLGEQDAVGHQLDVARRTRTVGEADLEPDRAAELGLQLVGNARGGGARRDASRLGMADQPLDSPAEPEADLRQLRRLARARLAANDHNLVVADRAGDLVALRADGEFGRELGPREVGAAAGKLVRAEPRAVGGTRRRTGTWRARGAGLGWLRHAREFTQAADCGMTAVTTSPASRAGTARTGSSSAARAAHARCTSDCGSGQPTRGRSPWALAVIPRTPRGPVRRRCRRSRVLGARCYAPNIR